MALGGSAARRYAEALLEIATDARAVDSYRASLDRLAAALGSDIIRALRDPRVMLERRRAALAAATRDEPKAIRGTLELLLQRDRLELLPDIARAYADLVDRREGIVKARVTTSVALPDAERTDVVRRLERASGKKVRATFAVDERIIGGAKVQIGDRLVDASLRTQLDQLARQLAG
jgi:F-type H+-transporting ATPase subunit delta